MSLLERFQSLFQSSHRTDLKARFEILRKAISGTMSKFYQARDLKSDEIVGLKVGDREKVTFFESRFKGLKKPCEGEIAIGMDHPLIVKTHEYGVSTDGLQFIVMDFIDGPGLQQLLRNQDPVLEGHRLRLIRQMAEAVKYVHDRDFIHRDVCPRNFIYDSASNDLRLIDFGLTLPARQEFMQPGNRTGTPVYMAPEIVRRRWTDKRVDIFAMGVSAYQMCTYELPWPVTDTSGQAALAHDTHPPRDIRSYRPSLNKTLARAIMQCLEANPNDRPETVDRFLSSIRHVRHEDS
jgi:serine/threonine protein kinase